MSLREYVTDGPFFSEPRLDGWECYGQVGVLKGMYKGSLILYLEI